MDKIKINQLLLEQELSDQHLLVVQKGTEETKSTTLQMLKKWLDCISHSQLLSLITAGEGIEITTDNKAVVISTKEVPKWYISDIKPTTANENDILLTSSGSVFIFKNKIWVDTGINLQGPQGKNGEDGFSPVVTMKQENSGVFLSIKDKNKEYKSIIPNGKDGCTPYINEYNYHWMINNIDTGIKAKGLDGVNGTSCFIEVEELEDQSGYKLVIKDGTGNYERIIKHGTNGINGIDGVDGISPTISIGTVSIGAAGTSPIITNSGTDTNLILDFTIPKGQDGGNSISISDEITIPAANWINGEQTISTTLDIGNRNVIDINPVETKYWAAFQVIPIEEDPSYIKFSCSYHPTVDLHFKITSMKGGI